MSKNYLKTKNNIPINQRTKYIFVLNNDSLIYYKFLKI